MEELASLREMTIKRLAEINRDRRAIERTVTQLAVEGGLGPVLQALNSQLRVLIESATEHEKLLNAIDHETDILTYCEADPFAAEAHIHAIELLWQRKALVELRAVLALVVSYVDIRLDQP